MSDLTELTSLNFEHLYESQLTAMANSRYVNRQLRNRRGVNPTLDGLLGEEDFAQNLLSDISQGIRQIVVMTGGSRKGLVVITPNVEVKELNYGRTIIKGTCVEAVTTSGTGAVLRDLYGVGTNMALDSYSRSNVFAVERYQPPVKVSRKSKSQPEFKQRSLRFVIGSVLPMLDSANLYVRSDNEAAERQLTEVMSLRLFR